MNISSTEDIIHFIKEFENGTLPKARWTHQAHFVAAFWYLWKHPYDEALHIMRQRIRAYNDAVGTINSDTSGYHETLTRLYLQGVEGHMKRHAELAPVDSLNALLDSPLARRDWPMQFYSRERLFSVEARRDWIPPEHPVT